MEKTLTISGKEVPFKSTGAFFLRYKAQFGKDPLGVLQKMGSTLEQAQKNGNFEQVELEPLYNIVWTLAKTANSNIETPMEWLDNFDEFPLLEILPELEEMILSTIQATKKIKNV